MERLRLSAEGWSHEPVLRARGFRDHLRGLRGRQPGSSMLLETSSVHSFGLKTPFRAIGVTDSHVVSRVTIVRPWRISMFPGCRYVVELPMAVPPPTVGARLEVAGV